MFELDKNNGYVVVDNNRKYSATLTRHKEVLEREQKKILSLFDKEKLEDDFTISKCGDNQTNIQSIIRMIIHMRTSLVRNIMSRTMIYL